MTMFTAGSISPVLAAGDPLSHVLDAWLIEGWFTWHMLFIVIAACICLFGLTSLARGITAAGPRGTLSGLFEVILLFVRDEVVRPFMGKEGDQYLWIIWTFFCFILTCNMLGMIPYYGKTATGNFAVTAALALISFVIYHSIGIKNNGFVPYLKANLLVGPWPLWPLMIVIEIAGHLIKPIALAIRLCANMVAGHIMLAVILSFGAVTTWALLPVAGVAGVAAIALTFLELLVAMIQAFIFTFLTTVFLSMAVHPDH